MSYLFTLIVGCGLGWLYYDYQVFKRNRIKYQEPAKPIDRIFIEKHHGSYLAYSEGNQFRGQSTNLEELALNVLGSNPSVILATNDHSIIPELRQLSFGQSDRKSHATNQAPVDTHPE